MLDQRPKALLAMPAFNEADVLVSLAPSIRNTLQDLRHPQLTPLLVDDGSTDDTAQIARTSPVVTSLLTTQHGNGAASRNAGIDAATGDWIAFLDADDLWYSNHLERVSQLLADTNDVGCLCLADHVYAARSLGNCDSAVAGISRTRGPG